VTKRVRASAKAGIQLARSDTLLEARCGFEPSHTEKKMSTMAALKHFRVKLYYLKSCACSLSTCLGFFTVQGSVEEERD